MKKYTIVIVVLFLSINIQAQNALKLGINCLPTKYNVGFIYVDTLLGDDKLFSVELLEYTKYNSFLGSNLSHYSWYCKRIGLSNYTKCLEQYGYVDDLLIDCALGIAYIDTKKEEVIYYDKRNNHCYSKLKKYPIGNFCK